MTGRGREIADAMRRRKIDVMCVQGTKWKGSNGKELEDGLKVIYNGTEKRRNGVGSL